MGDRNGQYRFYPGNQLIIWIDFNRPLLKKSSTGEKEPEIPFALFSVAVVTSAVTRKEAEIQDRPDDPGGRLARKETVSQESPVLRTGGGGEK